MSVCVRLLWCELVRESRILQLAHEELRSQKKYGVGRGEEVDGERCGASGGEDARRRR